MTIHTATIGDYGINYNDASDDNPIMLLPNVQTYSYYSKLPTAEECNAALETSGRLLQIKFFQCQNMMASPIFPKEVHSFGSAFEECQSLLVAPKVPKAVGTGRVGYYYYGFEECPSLIHPATIPKNAVNIAQMYYNDISLKNAASIPKNVKNITSLYEGCVELSGEFCIRPTSFTNKTGVLKNTTKTITIYGDQTLCEAVAATANNGNASWQPWYDPVPAVTNRGQGSYTTAEDMTRMVRNGCLAVDSYAPGRMVYNRGDIVRQDEWEALVEAAQTIDPTVTMSTHYTNLNKIEKAFDDAL